MKFPSYLKVFAPGAVGCLVLLAAPGCGGGGGGSAPENYAPASLNGRKLVVRDAQLSLETNYTFTSGSFSTPGDTGSYAYSRDAALHHANLTLIGTTTGGVTAAYKLIFANPLGGQYTVTKTGSGGSQLTESSTFRLE